MPSCRVRCLAGKSIQYYSVTPDDRVWAIIVATAVVALCFIGGRPLVPRRRTIRTRTVVGARRRLRNDHRYNMATPRFFREDLFLLRTLSRSVKQPIPIRSVVNGNDNIVLKYMVFIAFWRQTSHLTLVSNGRLL